MKKLLCAALVLIILAMTAAAVIPVSASQAPEESEFLVVTVNGENPTRIAVGNEFILRIGLYAGETRILDGQANLTYDVDYLAFDAYGKSPEEGEPPEADFYSFSTAIYNGGLVTNYGVPGMINYNFTKAKGVAVMNDASKLFARFRFKAKAAGTTDITHIMQYMINTDEQRVYYKGLPCEPINPYMIYSVEPSLGCAGDADGDNAVTIMDATFTQRAAAGEDLSYDVVTADVTGDNLLSLKDAVVIRKFLAGKSVDSGVGSWLFASES